MMTLEELMTSETVKNINDDVRYLILKNAHVTSKEIDQIVWYHLNKILPSDNCEVIEFRG